MALVAFQCAVNYLYALIMGHTVLKQGEDTTKTSFYACASLTYLLAMVTSNKEISHSQISLHPHDRRRSGALHVQGLGCSKSRVRRRPHRSRRAASSSQPHLRWSYRSCSREDES